MIEFPSTEQQFDEVFITDEDCMEYLISVRWPEGVKCPICHCDKLWRNNNGHILECSACSHRMRPLVGTIFQDTHLPLKIWFKMAWYIMSQKYGTNSIGLSRVLDLSKTTTRNILHKFRRSMVRAEREKLGPVVEVDETFYGSPEEGKPGRGSRRHCSSSPLSYHPIEQSLVELGSL